MNKHIIDFYLITNKLKNKLRTGWLEVEISKERTESVAEHIYGCLMLSIALINEYKISINLEKVLYMLSLHELEECLMPDFTLRSGITPEEKIELGKKSVLDATKSLNSQNEIVELLDEFNARKTKEAKFCYLIDKIECDFQAKIYDMEGVFDVEKSKEDLAYFGSRAEEIEKISTTASDYWIEFDKPKFEDDEIFKSLIDDIKNL